MRIVVDLQSGQTGGSKTRGIGRYSMALLRAMLQRGAAHDFQVVLNARYAAAADEVREQLHGLIAAENIRLFHVSSSISDTPTNSFRRRTAEKMREAFIAALAPDVVHTTSLFEGFNEDAVTSLPLGSSPSLNAVTLYDLIPLLNPDPYLLDRGVSGWYHRKVAALRRADLLLAISESSRGEAITGLGIDPTKVVNISSAIDDRFRQISVSAPAVEQLYKRLGLGDGFIMYTGGIDHRKNVEGLIRAYSRLPEATRSHRQLAIVCSISEHDRRRLSILTASLELAPDRVVLTGFVSDDDLLTLYNLCALFVFPSLHEGFGLPALEAMACGAPTIAADNSSLPEVVGLDDALFQASDLGAITAKMKEALDDERFRQSLVAHGLAQAQKFSWNRSAQRALAAFEDKRAVKPAVMSVGSGRALPAGRPRLAFVSPLPPEASGIADYSAELIKYLVRYYEIELISDQMDMNIADISSNFIVCPVEIFRPNIHRYDRIIYHFGNSHLHGNMFDLIKEFPGTVVLHDLYLGHLQNWREYHQQLPGLVQRSLLAEHGWPAMRFYLEHGLDEAVWTYPLNLGAIGNAQGLIVHSQSSAHAVASAYRLHPAEEIAVIPLLRALPETDRSDARLSLGLATDDYLICSFGGLGLTKLNAVLLEAFLALDFVRFPHARLVFVGKNDSGIYGASLNEKIAANPHGNRVAITGFAMPELYRRYLNGADCAVQLRQLSRGETSAAALDCMAYGVPLVVNSHGTMADLDPAAVFKMSEQVTVEELKAALELIMDRPDLGTAKAAAAREQIEAAHGPSGIAALYHQAIEHFAKVSRVGRRQALITTILDDPEATAASTVDLAAISEACAANETNILKPRLFVDISVLVQVDARSGIQRVVRSILLQLLTSVVPGFTVVPSYVDLVGDLTVLKAANRFTAGFMEASESIFEDEIVTPNRDDVYFGLDLAPSSFLSLDRAGLLMLWRARGVAIHCVVYDLLPITLPDFFEKSVRTWYEDWLAAVVRYSDSLLCISEAVAQELRGWIAATDAKHHRALRINSFPLSGNVAESVPTTGVPEDARQVLDIVRASTTALMVGTIEPRKGHADMLDAFDEAWRTGFDGSLLIVGKKGWLADALISRIEDHPRLDQSLFWVEGASDEYLQLLYAAADGLIAASHGEGFGLPLVEAARHDLPILARDLPVFREVAREHATYFGRQVSPIEIAATVKDWFRRLRDGTAPASSGILPIDWATSSRAILGSILPAGNDARDHAPAGPMLAAGAG